MERTFEKRFSETLRRAPDSTTTTTTPHHPHKPTPNPPPHRRRCERRDTYIYSSIHETCREINFGTLQVSGGIFNHYQLITYCHTSSYYYNNMCVQCSVYLLCRYTACIRFNYNSDQNYFDLNVILLYNLIIRCAFK